MLLLLLLLLLLLSTMVEQATLWLWHCNAKAAEAKKMTVAILSRQEVCLLHTEDGLWCCVDDIVVVDEVDENEVILTFLSSSIS